MISNPVSCAVLFAFVPSLWVSAVDPDVFASDDALSLIRVHPDVHGSEDTPSPMHTQPGQKESLVRTRPGSAVDPDVPGQEESGMVRMHHGSAVEPDELGSDFTPSSMRTQPGQKEMRNRAWHQEIGLARELPPSAEDGKMRIRVDADGLVTRSAQQPALQLADVSEENMVAQHPSTMSRALSSVTSLGEVEMVTGLPPDSVELEEAAAHDQNQANRHGAEKTLAHAEGAEDAANSAEDGTNNADITKSMVDATSSEEDRQAPPAVPQAPPAVPQAPPAVPQAPPAVTAPPAVAQSAVTAAPAVDPAVHGPAGPALHAEAGGVPPVAATPQSQQVVAPQAKEDSPSLVVSLIVLVLFALFGLAIGFLCHHCVSHNKRGFRHTVSGEFDGETSHPEYRHLNSHHMTHGTSLAASHRSSLLAPRRGQRPRHSTAPAVTSGIPQTSSVKTEHSRERRTAAPERSHHHDSTEDSDNRPHVMQGHRVTMVKHHGVEAPAQKAPEEH